MGGVAAFAFDDTHISAYWSRLGKLASRSTEARERLHADPSLEAGRVLTEQALGLMSSRNLATVAHSLAKAGVMYRGPWEGLWAQLAELSIPKLAQFSVQELKMLAWGMAHSGAPAPALFAAFASELLDERRCSELAPCDLASFAWSLSMSARAAVGPKHGQAAGGRYQPPCGRFEPKLLVQRASSIRGSPPEG